MARYASDRRDLVWAGLAVAFLGLVGAAYAATGDRVYHIEYVLLFLAGAAAALVGGIVAAWGRVGPSTRAEPLVPFRDERRDEVEPGEAGSAEAPPLEGGDGPREVVAVACPDCGTEWHADGVRPFAATCPDCGLEGRIPREA